MAAEVRRLVGHVKRTNSCLVALWATEDKQKRETIFRPQAQKDSLPA